MNRKSLNNHNTLKQKVYSKFKKNGCSNTGQISVFNKGGGAKNKKYFVSSFNFYRGVAEDFEFDPNRNSFLLKIFDIDKRKHFYTLLTYNLRLGSFVVGNFQTKIKLGNRCSIKNIPSGTLLNNVDSKTTNLNLKKQLFAKSAGCFCQLIQKSKDSCLIKLPSGKYKKISSHSFATIGLICNSDFKTVNLKKAGRSRWLNKRPKVRGVAMNPVDHPHGGGEGKSSGGRHLVSAWGKTLKK
jgi:large subunit ribosomal protein L2